MGGDEVPERLGRGLLLAASALLIGYVVTVAVSEVSVMVKDWLAS